MAEQQNWRLSFGLAALGIIGTLVAPVIAHFLNVSQERGREFKQRQRDAYLACATALPKLKQAQEAAKGSEEASKLSEYEASAEAAFRKVALYGDREVVDAVADWYRSYDLPLCNEHQKSEIATWEAMRKSSLGADSIDAESLAALVTHCKLK